MQDSLLARPYAESLYHIIKHEDSIQRQVMLEYKWIVDMMKSDESWRVFLETPSISRAAKEGFFENVLRGKCHNVLVNFLSVLAKKRRLLLLEEIYTQVLNLSELKGEKIRVSITTAVELNPASRERIIKDLQEKYNSTIILEEKINPELLGGFILRVEDTLIDGSIQHHLVKMKNRILERSKTYGI